MAEGDDKNCAKVQKKGRIGVACMGACGGGVSWAVATCDRAPGTGCALAEGSDCGRDLAALGPIWDGGVGGQGLNLLLFAEQQRAQGSGRGAGLARRLSTPLTLSHSLRLTQPGTCLWFFGSLAGAALLPALLCSPCYAPLCSGTDWPDWHGSMSPPATIVISGSIV